MDPPTLISVTPDSGFVIQERQVKIKGSNLLNLNSTKLKFEFLGTQDAFEIIDRDEFLFIDNENLIATIPNAVSIAF